MKSKDFHFIEAQLLSNFNKQHSAPPGPFGWSGPSFGMLLIRVFICFKFYIMYNLQVKYIIIIFNLYGTGLQLSFLNICRYFDDVVDAIVSVSWCQNDNR